MAAGPLIAAQAQSTTTTTGTGTLTIVNSVPAGAPAGSSTFAAAFAPTAVFPVANIFYALIDASGNIEAGYGTLLSATSFSRDFVIFAGTANNVAPYVPALLSTPTGGFINLAAGTANLYSNPGLLSQVTPYQQRFPNFTGSNSSSAQDGGMTEDIMQGSFTGSITNGGVATTGTVNYKVSSNGEVMLSFPAALTNNTTGTTSVMTGLPSYLANLTTQNIIGPVVSNGATVLGLYVITAGATPTSTGTITLQQSTGVSPIAFSGTFTTAVVNGIPATTITYSLH
jgi:hypothetical protein